MVYDSRVAGSRGDSARVQPYHGVVQGLHAVAVMSSRQVPPPSPRKAQCIPRYPRLNPGSLVTLIGMGLATSCGGAGPNFYSDAGIGTGGSGGKPSAIKAVDAGVDSGDTDPADSGKVVSPAGGTGND